MTSYEGHAEVAAQQSELQGTSPRWDGERPGSASARPGPCTRPRSADALARREYHPARRRPASRSFVLGHVAGHRDRSEVGWAACGRSTLTPGTGRVVPSPPDRAFRPTRSLPAGRGRYR